MSFEARGDRWADFVAAQGRDLHSVKDSDARFMERLYKATQESLVWMARSHTKCMSETVAAGQDRFEQRRKARFAAAHRAAAPPGPAAPDICASPLPCEDSSLREDPQGLH
eukprot:5404100-Pyramimonas_sp.AAC.1